MSKVYNNTPVVKVDKKEVSTNVINGTVTVDYMNELLKIKQENLRLSRLTDSEWH